MDMTIAGLAALHSRRSFLPKVVRSILPQVDELHISFNGPEWNPTEVWEKTLNPLAYKIQTIFHPSNSRGDAMKFFPVFNKGKDPSYFFSIDDDLIYPPTYVKDLINWLGLFDNKVIVSLHGSILFQEDFPLTSFYDQRGGIPCLGPLHIPVHSTLPGTGVSAFHTGVFRPTNEEFHLPNMADILCGIAAARRGIPTITIPHEGEGKYLIYNRDLRIEDTIWGQEHNRDERQTQTLNQFEEDYPGLLFQPLPLDLPHRDKVYEPRKPDA